MGGTTQLRQIQFAKESNPGDGGTASVQWYGEGEVEDDRTVELASHKIGNALRNIDSSYIPATGSLIPLEETELTFQQAPVIFNAAIRAVTGAPDGGGSNFIYDYLWFVTQTALIDTLAIFGGNNQLVQLATFCFVTDFVISAESQEAVMIAANFIGRSPNDSAFLNLTTPTVEQVLSGTTKFSMDNSGGVIGTTLITDTLSSFELDVVTGWKGKPLLDRLDHSILYHDGEAAEATLTLQYEHNTDANAERDNFEIGQIRLIQILCEGSAFGTGGTDFQGHTFRIRATGVITDFSLADDEGNDFNVIEFALGISEADLAQVAGGLELLISNELTDVYAP